MKASLRILLLGSASIALFSACPAMRNQGIHDYVNHSLEIPANQISFYLGRRNVDDFSALDVDPERIDPNPNNMPGDGTHDYLPDFPVDPNPNTKNLDVSDNIFVGIEYSEIIRDTVGWEVGLFYSEQEDATRHTYYTGLDTDGVTGVGPRTTEVKTDIEFIELSMGGRYTYPHWRHLQPYAGAGLDIILADIPKPQSVFGPLEMDVTEWSNQRKLLYGAYAHAGVNVRVGWLLLGVDGRALFWADERINYLQAAVTVGYAF